MLKQVIFRENMKKLYSVLFMFLLISCTASAQSDSKNTSLELNDNGSIITLYWKQDKEQKIIHDFTFIPSYKKHLYSFPDGSIVGFLPTKNMDLKLKRWSDFNHDFTLFYCDSKTGEFKFLEKDIGWSFHILSSEKLESRWIVITKEGEAVLFLLHEDGNITNKINFSTSFYPDFVEFDELNKSTGKLLFGIIDREAIYKIDFKNNTAHIVDDYATEAH